jgi:hypothetical protein
MAFKDLPIRDYLFRNAERWIASSGFIDTIDLQSGAQTGTSTPSAGGPIDLGLVGVGKYVTRDLFLKYSRDFTGQSENQVTAEYRVTRHLLLRGQQIQRKQTSNEPAQEYNLDLKIRVEYWAGSPTSSRSGASPPGGSSPSRSRTRRPAR